MYKNHLTSLLAYEYALLSCILVMDPSLEVNVISASLPESWSQLYVIIWFRYLVIARQRLAL